ncbi:scoloptoxin SSD976-like [Homarus americanus]|uniref:scoloptoxin SSD976-like n=1 Tax=Homarus americanus TaxID=6706 RepID=UPI001C47D4E8|nr:scoloptoxin SSD976-like [Homarus americanus]
MLLPANAACNYHYSGVTEEQKDQILRKHNTLREQVATGGEITGDPGPQPSAADMKEMVWNDELAQVAQKWAEQCPSGHDNYAERRICSADYQVGQNLYWEYSFNSAIDWEKAIQAWYDEVADMPNTVVESFTSSVPSGKAIGHYTQVVWGRTFEVGCGIISHTVDLSGTTYPESKVMVCNYGPAGNFRGSPVYTKGYSSSLCTSGKSSNYPGLCTSGGR